MILNVELCFLYLNLLLFSYSVPIPACVAYSTPHFNYTMASDSSDGQVQVRQVNTSSKSKQIAQVSFSFSSTIFMLDRKYAVEDSTYPARTACEPFAKGQISLPSFLPFVL
jgi:hypothetical protein